MEKSKKKNIILKNLSLIFKYVEKKRFQLET